MSQFSKVSGPSLQATLGPVNCRDVTMIITKYIITPPSSSFFSLWTKPHFASLTSTWTSIQVCSCCHHYDVLVKDSLHVWLVVFDLFDVYYDNFTWDSILTQWIKMKSDTDIIYNQDLGKKVDVQVKPFLCEWPGSAMLISLCCQAMGVLWSEPLYPDIMNIFLVTFFLLLLFWMKLEATCNCARFSSGFCIN